MHPENIQFAIFAGIIILVIWLGVYYMGVTIVETMEHDSARRKELEKNYLQEKKGVTNSSFISSAIQIKHRNPVVVIILSIVTLGIYAIYWTVKTKEEINGLGASIPTAWLLILPIVHIYFVYRYAKDFSVYVKKDNHPILWFLLYLVVAPVFMIFVQVGLNKYAIGSNSAQQKIA